MSFADQLLAVEEAAADALSKFARPRTGTFAAVGDSISALGDASTSGSNANIQHSFGASWHTFLSLMSNQRLRRIGYFATPGFTLEQIRDTHLPQVLALSPAPEACFIGGGTNGVTTPDPQFAALLTIVDRLIAAGIRPVLVKIPPRNDNTTNRSAVVAWNARIHLLAQARGFQYLDMFTPLVNLATAGDYTTGLTGDFVHPTAEGLAKIATFNLARPGWLDRFGDGAPYLTALQQDPATLIDSSRGLFLTDANSDGLADGWTVGAAGATYSRSQDASGYWWQRINKATTSSTQGSIFRVVSTGITPGQKVMLTALANVLGKDFNWSLYATPRNASNVALSDPQVLKAARTISGAATTGLFLYAEQVVPATTTNYQVTLEVGSAAPAADSYVEFARLGMFVSG